MDASHPLRADIERFWAAAAACPELAELLDAPGSPPVVRSVLRLGPASDSLLWLCTSVQRPAEGPYAAVTVRYRPDRDRLERFTPATDPGLPQLAALEPEVGSALQYVPLRRFAYRVGDGRPGSPIAKAMRPVELDEAWRRLELVWRASRRARPGFAVAEPLGIDRERGVFYQSTVPGTEVSSLVDAGNLHQLLHRAGAVHGELQALPASGLPRWSPEQLVPEIRAHARLVALFRPEAAPPVTAVRDLLLASVPRACEPAFCHGDLRCGHLLALDDAWSVIDADGCRLGDPCQDVARLLAFLELDVPYLRDRLAITGDDGARELDQAVAAYLDGYRSTGRRLDDARLAWYLLAHQLHFLARLFKRDRYAPSTLERGLARLRGLEARLRVQLAGGRRP
ncbi:MAG: aminoglycoside phosphotransferase family protein [Thermoleophilia bacterium]